MILSMTGRELREFRKNSGLTQEKAARVLGVSQTYLSLLEKDRRPLTEKVKQKVVRKLHASPTKLHGKVRNYQVRKVSDDQLTAELAALGYKGFSHRKTALPQNPADVLLSALNANRRDARLIEALPWLLLTFPDMPWDDLVLTARTHLLQNRLGFVTNVARQLAEMLGEVKLAERLRKAESELEYSRLEREDTLCNETMTRTERNWLSAKRPENARQWHMLTDLTPSNLRYVR